MHFFRPGLAGAETGLTCQWAELTGNRGWSNRAESQGIRLRLKRACPGAKLPPPIIGMQIGPKQFEELRKS